MKVTDVCPRCDKHISNECHEIVFVAGLSPLGDPIIKSYTCKAGDAK